MRGHSLVHVDRPPLGGWFRWRPDVLARAAGGVVIDPAHRVAAAHGVAILATVLVLAVDGGAQARTDVLITGLMLSTGFAVLRVMSVGRRLAISTLVLDAAGTVLFVAGTDAPASAYYFLALAGVWWAAHVPRKGSGLVWAIAFAAAYGALVVPVAVRDGLLVRALEDLSVVFIVGLLSDRFVRVDRRALELSETLAHAPKGADTIAIRDGLSRALGPMEITLDVMLAAAQAGLTVIQAELLAYLLLGLTNREIGDATHVSEATVRYRLTRLYRVLGVTGRHAAVARAHALGLPMPAALPASSRRLGRARR